mgnify:CR=1 FL=1
MKVKRITVILIVIVLIVLFFIIRGILAFNSAIMEGIEFIDEDEEIAEEFVEDENKIIGERNSYIF